MKAVDLDPQALASVRCLAGSLDTLTNEPLLPFSEEALAFLAALSSALIKDPASRPYPDITTLAFWCRKSNLERLRREAQERAPLIATRVGRGLSFHIAPSNIPINFAFSFAFALLAGNSSIVRVPSKPFAQTTIVCRAVAGLLPHHPAIEQRCAFVAYPIDNSITAAFSRRADARLIWGGDATVARVRTLPTMPRCMDILFSDRYSIALINGTSIDEADEKALDVLAEGFYNDTYLMDQNACSSPQVMFWVQAAPQSKQRFWDAVLRQAQKRYSLQAQVSVDKYVQLCGDIIDGIVEGPVAFDGLLTVIDAKLPEDMSVLRGTGGYFYQTDVQSLRDIVPFVTQRFQTLLYYGFDKEELRRVVLENRLRGIDRIVPVGAAMDMGPLWDGYDLISELSRIVDAR